MNEAIAVLSENQLSEDNIGSPVLMVCTWLSALHITLPQELNRTDLYLKFVSSVSEKQL